MAFRQGAVHAVVLNDLALILLAQARDKRHDMLLERVGRKEGFMGPRRSS
jgi:hypothetical protein